MYNIDLTASKTSFMNEQLYKCTHLQILITLTNLYQILSLSDNDTIT